MSEDKARRRDFSEKELTEAALVWMRKNRANFSPDRYQESLRLLVSFVFDLMSARPDEKSAPDSPAKIMDTERSNSGLEVEPAPAREVLRAAWKVRGVPWLRPGDILLVNVNQHQRRKDVPRCLQILAELRRRGHDRFKLYLHMREEGAHDGVRLESIGRQLGLRAGADWCHGNEVFLPTGESTWTEAMLNGLYNGADLFLTTTLGEGFGLTAVEALAAGCPVALPQHTACEEIGRTLRALGLEDRILFLPLEKHAAALMQDGSRLRHRVEVHTACNWIVDYWKSGALDPARRRPLPAAAAEWLSWDRIAREMLAVLCPESKVPSPDGGSGRPPAGSETGAPPEDSRLQTQDPAGLPSILKQTPWRAGFFNLRPPVGEAVYNASVAVIGRQALLCARVERGPRNRLGFFPLTFDAAGDPAADGRRQMLDVPAGHQMEDPRVTVDEARERLWVAAAYYFPKDQRFWVQQTLLELDFKLKLRRWHWPVYGANGGGPLQNTGHEKNWGWFWSEAETEAEVRKPKSESRGHLHCVYRPWPMEVARFEPAGEAGAPPDGAAPVEQGALAAVARWEQPDELAPWDYGEVRGGSPPVRAGAEYVTFFHSSLPGGAVWHKRIFYMGALAFEARPPWRVTRMTREPLLAGSKEDYLVPLSPLVVYPCGAALMDGTWLVTLGVNDAASAWLRVPHAALLERMSKL